MTILLTFHWPDLSYKATCTVSEKYIKPTRQKYIQLNPKFLFFQIKGKMGVVMVSFHYQPDAA